MYFSAGIFAAIWWQTVAECGSFPRDLGEKDTEKIVVFFLLLTVCDPNTHRHIDVFIINLRVVNRQIACSPRSL